MHVTFVVAAALYMLAANEDMKQSCNDLKICIAQVSIKGFGLFT